MIPQAEAAPLLPWTIPVATTSNNVCRGPGWTRNASRKLGWPGS